MLMCDKCLSTQPYMHTHTQSPPPPTHIPPSPMMVVAAPAADPANIHFKMVGRSNISVYHPTIFHPCILKAFSGIIPIVRGTSPEEGRGRRQRGRGEGVERECECVPLFFSHECLTARAAHLCTGT